MENQGSSGGSSTTEYNWADHSFNVAKKTIIEVADIELFKASDTYIMILDFIAALQKSVKGTTISSSELPEVILSLIIILVSQTNL
jgi:hypothetical protein